jgi:hypothetical protein
MLAESTEGTPTELQVQYEYDLSETRHSVVRDSETLKITCQTINLLVL